jgi:redox-sensitive bicupin YhaK (pirin superfamily)
MDQGVWIHQNAWFSLGEFTQDMDINYTLNSDTNGVYAFIIEGDAVIQKQKLEKRDGFGIWNSKEINISAKKNSKIILMEVPMRT